MARKVLRQFCFRGDISKGLYNQLIYVGIYKSVYHVPIFPLLIWHKRNWHRIHNKKFTVNVLNMNCCQNKMSLLSETAITIILFPNHS